MIKFSSYSRIIWDSKLPSLSNIAPVTSSSEIEIDPYLLRTLSAVNNKSDSGFSFRFGCVKTGSPTVDKTRSMKIFFDIEMLRSCFRPFPFFLLTSFPFISIRRAANFDVKSPFGSGLTHCLFAVIPSETSAPTVESQSLWNGFPSSDLTVSLFPALPCPTNISLKRFNGALLSLVKASRNLVLAFSSISSWTSFPILLPPRANFINEQSLLS
mmetsp:Transcript_18492/g.22724  ORF Transcript_18492/g.22724 Transcript_18492/m.22724 type:complete len:213 (-) Transcript_18492:2005-2643(-)